MITTDPVKQGLAESLARPGGNFTGASIDAGLSIHGKRIALLREMVPTMSKLGCLALRFQWNGSSSVAFRAAAEMAGLPLAVSLLEFGTSEADIRAAVESISRDGANAVMVLDSPQVLQNSTLIAKLLGDAKLPAIFAFTESVEAGGLMAYSFDLIELHRRAAHNIDAILRGAKPRHPDLPSNKQLGLSYLMRSSRGPIVVVNNQGQLWQAADGATARPQLVSRHRIQAHPLVNRLNLSRNDLLAGMLANVNDIRDAQNPTTAAPPLLFCAALLGRWFLLLSEGIGGFVIAVAAAEEHQRHQTAPDDEGEERAKAKGDPAVLIHHSLAGRVPHRDRPYCREDQYDDQGGQKSGLAHAKSFHGSSISTTRR